MLKVLVKFLLGLFLLPLLSSLLPAEQRLPDFHIVGSLKKISELGDSINFALVVNLDIDKGFYIRKDNFDIRMPEGSPLKIVKKDFPRGGKKYDKFLEKELEIYTGPLSFKIEISVPKEKYLDRDIEFLVDFQACSSSICYILRTEKGLAHREKKELLAIHSIGKLDDLLVKGFFLAVIASFLMGVLSSLTPCVYPIIPIVVSVMGSQAEGRRSRGLILSSVFVLGLALVYSSLGLVAAKSGALFGSLLQSKYAVLAVSLIFLSMGLSLAGLFEIRLPYFISKGLGASRPARDGYIATLLAGMVTGIVAVPCVGPFVISILAFAAKTGLLLKGFALLFSFSLGMGILFILVGTFSSLLFSLPKSGIWMVMVKKIFGLIMIAVAFYYSRLALSPVFDRVTFSVILGFALFLLSFVFMKLPDLGSASIRRFHRGIAIFSIVGSIVLLLSPLLLSEVAREGMKRAEKGASGAISWLSSEKDALELALSQNAPVIIDFYADWCPSCIELDKYTFSDKGVAEKAKKFKMLRIDMTGDDEESSRVAAKYMVSGLPTILFLDPKGKVIEELTVIGYLDPDDFIGLMDKALSR